MNECRRSTPEISLYETGKNNYDDIRAIKLTVLRESSHARQKVLIDPTDIIYDKSVFCYRKEHDSRADKLFFHAFPMLMEIIMQELLFMEPVFKQMIWGGSRLGTEWGYPVPGNDTGECWAISAHPNGDCRIRNGQYKGQTLSSLFCDHRELFGGIAGDRFPLLIKIIDANQDLSLQVHPDDGYAFLNENGSLGKTECWYILDAPENASLVIGHHAKTREELEDMIRNGRWDDFIRRIPVKKGDFIQVDPGTVHAITSGILLMETQQNSDITYRIYDYGRLQNGKPRELHVEKSLDVIRVPAAAPEDSVLHAGDLPVNQVNELISCRYYRVFRITSAGSCSFPLIPPFLCISVIGGSGKINGCSVKKGDHFIVPSGTGSVEIEGDTELIASVPVTAMA